MVDPVTGYFLVSTGLKVASSIFGHKAQNDQKKENTKLAQADYYRQLRDLGIRQLEETKAVSQQAMLAERQAQASQGDVRVSAASAGVTGASVEAMLREIEASRGEYKTSLDQNLAATTRQIGAMKEEAKAQSDARIAGVPGANPFATALQIGGALGEGYMGWKNSKVPPIKAGTPPVKTGSSAR